MNTRRLTLIVLSVVMALTLFAFTACKGEEDIGYLPGAEVGNYYCVVDGEDATLSLTDKGEATLKLGKESLTGLCVKDPTNPDKIAIAFGESVDLVAEATYSNNAVTLLFRTKEYRFLRDVNYTITFDSKGGSNVAPLSVRNGKTATKPADPVYEGKTFLGWYKDEAFTEPYQFGAEAVTANLTLYACYGESAEGEFQVVYNPNYEGATVTDGKTVGGIATLPAEEPKRDGYEFLGWFVSDYGTANKLTYKYSGQTLYENTTLYGVWKAKSTNALAVSVDGNKISWNSLGAGTYNVYVYDDDGDVIDTFSPNGTSVECDFASLAAGDYRVEVTSRGVTGTAYLRNKGLKKVSLFQIANGTALSYNGVPNATEYVVSIDCGNPYHKHTALSNGASTTYNFANCDMQKGGIKFTVTAKADGYMDSVSETFIFEQGLGEVKDLAVNENGELVWTAVENATSYVVTVTTQEGEKKYYLTDNALSLRDYGVCNMTIAVEAIADKYYSQDATQITYNKATLAAPLNVRISETTLVWDATENATYKVKIAGKEYEAKTNSFELKESYFTGKDWTVQVMMTKDGVKSLYSEEVNVLKIAKLTSDMLRYENGKVYWPNVFGAQRYRVSVNGSPRIVEKDQHEYAFDFTRSGEYTLSVTPYGDGIDSSTPATINVSVYGITFDPNNGTSVPMVYVATGDQIVLPESIKGGYDFVGWYNTVGGADSNGKEYHNGQFDYKSDLTMYASWTPKAYTVTMNWKNGDQDLSTTQTVYYREEYKLQVPESDSHDYAFGGWYSGSIKYTDEKGKSLVTYDRISDVTLEASFVKVLEFELEANGESYSVKKGPYINLVNEITIPKTYNGKPVLSIVGSAFDSCSTLRTINIPDTVNYIFVGIEGIDATGSAFKGCTNLAAINVYETDALAGEKGGFWSEDGVLYYNNEMTKAVELYAYPKSRPGNLAIAEGVQTIAQYALKSATKLNTVTIPTSVTSIEKNAFASNYNLTKIEFLEAEEGIETNALEIADEAFYSLSNLLEVTLSSRIEKLNTNMFRSCSKLANVYFANDGGKYYANDGVVYTKDESNAVTLVYFPQGRSGDFTVPNGVTKIGDYAFTTRFANTSTTSTAKYTYSGNTKLTSITIPAWVTYIGEGAFRSATQVERVTLINNEQGSLTIAKYAFYGLTDTEFTTLTLPEQLISLGECAFGGCTKLTTVKLNSINCKDFATGAFASDTETTASTLVSYYVTDLHIGAKTSAIEIAGVFGSKLANVEVDAANPNYKVLDDKVVYDVDVTKILFVPVEKEGEYVTPATVTTIGANVFRSRTKMTKITIGKNVTNIGDEAFFGCNSLLEVAFEAGRTENLTLGNAVFKSCGKLTNVALPETTVSVGSELFNGCSKLETVSLPASLTDIAYGYDKTLKKEVFNMFTGSSVCPLNAVNVAESNTKYASKDGILYEKDDEGNLVTLLYNPCGKTGTIVVPVTVTAIADRAFAYSQAEILKFSEEGMEEGATRTLTLGDQVFQSSELKEVHLPTGLTEITDRMFYFCDTLVTIGIPNTVTKIGKEAFYYCKSMVYITIPNSVEEIGESAFASCYALTTVTFEEGNDDKDEDGNYLHPLTLANGSIVSGGSSGSTYNGIFRGAIVEELYFPKRTVYIGDYLMGYSSSYGSTTSCDSLVKVSIPSSIEYMGKYAFYYCESLETVEFYENGLSKLKDDKTSVALNSTFYGCKSLSKVINLPESSAEEGYSLSGTFSYALFDTFEVPASVKSLSGAFNYNKNLKLLTFKEGSKLEEIGACFYGCTALESIVLPDGLKKIGNGAFSSLTGLKSMTIPKTVQTIGNSAFSKASNLTEIIFATYEEGENKGKCDLAEIQYKAFELTGLTEITFPVSTNGDIALGGGTSNVDYMGRLFNNALDLTKVTLSSSINKIEYVFKGCPNLKTIVIADDNTSFKTVDGEPYIFSADGTGILFTFGTLPAGKYEIKTGVTEISAYAFEEQNNVTELVIPYTVEKLGTGAFANCSALTKVIFEDTPEHPSALKGSEIGAQLFMGCANLKTVELPNGQGMTVISDKMFQGSGITEIKIPANVLTIGEYAFDGCTNLVSLKFAEGSKLEYIDRYAFRKAAFEEVYFPATLETIDQYSFQGNKNLKVVKFLKDDQGKTALTKILARAFGSASEADACTAIEEIELPASLKEFGAYAFGYCTSLKNITFEAGSEFTTFGTGSFEATAITSIVIPAKVKKLVSELFENCEYLTTVEFEEGSSIDTIATYAFRNATALKSFAVPEGVKKIEAQTFLGCTALEKVQLPTTLTEITNYAFANCASLKSIDIPASVTTFGNYVFTGCTALETVNIPENSALKKFGTYVFSHNPSDSTTKGMEACVSLKSLYVPTNVEALGNYMFKDCTAFESITFADDSKLNFLGTYTFQGSGLKSIIVPKGVTMLGTSKTACSTTSSVYTFADCKNLTDVEFLANITKIGGYVFNGCTSLEMDIPATVTVIGQFAFANTGATSYTIPKGLSTGTTALGNGAFAYNEKLVEFKIASGNTKYVVDEESKALLTSTKTLVCYPAGLEVEGGAVTVPKGITIGAYAFAGCNNVKSINLPADTTTIPNYAFAGATGLTSFTVPAGVTKIGTTYSMGYVFDGCTALEEVNFLGDVTLIGGYAFRNCTSLTSINLPESVEIIGNGAFNGAGIKEVTISENITYYSSSQSNSPFANSAVEKVTINAPATLAYMFAYTPNLKEAVFGEQVTSLANYTFYESGIEKVAIPATIEKFGTYVFANCESLSDVTIAEGVTALNNYMFRGCTSLKSIKLPDTLTFLGTYTFVESGLESITIPKSVKTLAASATAAPTYTTCSYVFKDCTSLKTVVFHDEFEILTGYAFAGCTALEEIVIPDSVKVISSYAFKDCTNLKKITVSKNLEEFGYGVFQNCTSVEKIVFENPFTRVSRDLFNGWTEQQTICFKFSQDESADWITTWKTDCKAQIVWDYAGE